MRIEVSEDTVTNFGDYASIPIAFEVSSVLDVTEACDGIRWFVLTERRLSTPYVKDYDAIEGEHPTRWPTRFDVSNWVVFTARTGGLRVGGAVVAFNTPHLDMLEGRQDLAVLWDIRVSPDVRGKGVGSALFRAAEAWAKVRGCRQLKVETQNINVAACSFYTRHGCVLLSVRRYVYPTFPDEVQFFWCKDLYLNPHVGHLSSELIGKNYST